MGTPSFASGLFLQSTSPDTSPSDPARSSDRTPAAEAEIDFRGSYGAAESRTLSRQYQEPTFSANCGAGGEFALTARLNVVPFPIPRLAGIVPQAAETTSSKTAGKTASAATKKTSTQAQTGDKKIPKQKSRAQSRSAKAKRRRRAMSPRVRRMRQAFVASTSLRPMAQQLVQDRSAPAYAGVEAFARVHAKEDAGALAWLVVDTRTCSIETTPRPLSR